jgi:hypothetical protein
MSSCWERSLCHVWVCLFHWILMSNSHDKFVTALGLVLFRPLRKIQSMWVVVGARLHSVDLWPIHYYGWSPKHRPSNPGFSRVPSGFLRYHLGIGVRHYVVSTQGEGRQRIHQEFSFWSHLVSISVWTQGRFTSTAWFVCFLVPLWTSSLALSGQWIVTSSRHRSASRKSYLLGIGHSCYEWLMCGSLCRPHIHATRKASHKLHAVVTCIAR